MVLEILSGLPASGKSTYANRLVENGWHRVNWDSYRWFNTDGSPRDYKFSSGNERDVKLAALADAGQAVQKGLNVVVDNTNLTDNAKNYWRVFARRHNMAVVETDFGTNLDECLRRNDLRTGWQKVPRAVIERMALWNGRVSWPHPIQNIVIVDMDGTLADLSHRFKHVSGKCFADNCSDGNQWDEITEEYELSGCPTCKGTGKIKKDWKSFFEKVSEDKPIKGVIEWVRSLYESGYYVCVVSGRPLDAAGVATEDWLKKHDVPFHRLFMRAGQDKRDDVIVKQEILDRMPKNQIAFSIDDRPRVVRMWRANGVKCYDVGNGIEF